VTAYENVTVVKDDPDDDKFLAIAIVSGAEHIISGDTHLLSIGNYQGIEILTPADFLTNILPNTTKTE
jgi:predicted nucleic acid-binding protein